MCEPKYQCQQQPSVRSLGHIGNVGGSLREMFVINCVLSTIHGIRLPLKGTLGFADADPRVRPVSSFRDHMDTRSGFPPLYW